MYKLHIANALQLIVYILKHNPSEKKYDSEYFVFRKYSTNFLE